MVLRRGSTVLRATTGSDGAFFFATGFSPGATLTVQAPGFAAFERVLNASERRVEIVLTPARLLEQVTVTAARGETALAETAASVAVLHREQLEATAAPTLDDALRQVPGFILFRRSGSRTANPTAQGVSLRGVGASGASRAVVLHDGIPMNDPFGGWVYWGRVPLEAVASVEVLQGGASQLYGSDALGGVVQVLTRRPASATGSAQASFGTQNAGLGSAFGSIPLGAWSLSGSGELFHTDGYVLVHEDERGAVDDAAGSEHKTAEARLERAFNRGMFFVRGGFYHESRRNGTPLQRNRTRMGTGALGGELQTPHSGLLSLRFYGSGQQFDQTFTAVATDRASERLTRRQYVPAQQLGYTAQWSGAFRAHSIVAGLDGRHVRGHSDEIIFGLSGPTSHVDAGGRERHLGFFGQDAIRLSPRWLLTLGLRADHWRIHDGYVVMTSLPFGLGLITNLRDRTETAVSPRIALLHHVNDQVSFSVAAYRSFRAPTLNELYRSFRVGNVLTFGNPELRAERLTGGEAGVRIAPGGDRVALRGEFFWSEITRPVANVTFNVLPELISRQRQNLGRTRSRGFAFGAEARATTALFFSGGYQFADATVLRFPANTALEGLRIPQTPRHQFTMQMRYTRPDRVNLGIQARFGGEQFDDDQNQLGLERFFTVDVLASRALRPGVEAFVAAENIFDQRYSIGRTPVRTVAAPAQVRGGVRLRLGAR